MLSELALRRVAAIRPPPDLVIITGDLTECGLPEEYALLAGMLRRSLPMPVHVIPGNHDRREVLLAELPRFAQVQDGFIQYAINDRPARLVMLDTVVPGAAHGALCSRRLDWLAATLAAEPEKPTMIAMHHPPFTCGIAHMDRIALREPAAFAAIVARHRQVQGIVCGHHHRPVVAQVAQAVASIAPSAAYQVELDLAEDAAAFVLEPPGFQLHRWSAEHGFVSHTATVEAFPGPFPFFADPNLSG